MSTTMERPEEKQVPGRIPSRNDKAYSERMDRTGLWARVCATAGAAAWAGMAVLARMLIVRVGGIELMFLFAPLVIVPLAMELGRELERTSSGGEWLANAARWVQPFGAAAVVAAMWLPPGKRAALAALTWLLVCVLMASSGVMGLVRSPLRNAAGEAVANVTLAVAKIDLAVGGAWLVASRLGMRPMGVQEPIGLLTAVHFHYAGFATAMIAAATLRFAAERSRERWLKPVTLMVAGLPYVVAVGFVVSPALKMAAGLLFSASVATLAVLLRSCAMRATNASARILLQVAAGAVFVGMMFSGTYAIADFLGCNALTIPQMTRTHGLLNAVGFCLPGLLGWLVESDSQRRA